MIDQQPKLSYFPMEMKCNLGNQQQEDLDGGRVGGGGGPQANENNNNNNNNTVAHSNHSNANVSAATGSIGTNGTTGGSVRAALTKTPMTAVTGGDSLSQGHPITAASNSAVVGSGLLLMTGSVGGDDENGHGDLGNGGGGGGGIGSGVHSGGGHHLVAGLLGTSLCGQCCSPICDRYIMKVVDITYHERCLQCTSCSIRLMHSCFMRDGKLYCRFDYERLYGRNRCLGCGDKIGADELVMRALDNVFHLKCFICVVCGVRLQKGDQYVIKQSQLFCRPDYEKEVEMFQGYSYDDYCCDDMFQTRIDGRRGPKRPRTILTTQQRRAFKASFDISPKPCRKIREGLAKDTGLSIRIVQVWFQNQRAKMKKIQKKQLKEGSKAAHHGGSGGGAGGGGGAGAKNHAGAGKGGGIDSPEEMSDGETGGKLSLRIKDENSRSNAYLHDSCSDNEGTVTDNDGGPYGSSGGGRLGIGGGPDPFKIVKEELDLEDDYFRLAMGPTHHGHHHHHHHHHHHSHHNNHQHQHHQQPLQQHGHGPNGGARFGGKSFASELHSSAGTGPGAIKTENMALDSASVGMLGNGGPLEYGVSSLQQMAGGGGGGAGPPTAGNATSGGGNAGGPHDSQPGMLNPIDRLYSMQNSYFCNQDGPAGPNHPPGHPGTPPNQRPPAAPAPQHQGPMQQLPHHAGVMHQHQQHQHFLANGTGLGGGGGGPGLCNSLLDQQQQQQQESVM